MYLFTTKTWQLFRIYFQYHEFCFDSTESPPSPLSAAAAAVAAAFAAAAAVAAAVAAHVGTSSHTAAQKPYLKSICTKPSIMVLTRLQKKQLLAAVVVCAVAIDAQTPRERRGNVHRWVLVLCCLKFAV